VLQPARRFVRFQPSSRADVGGGWEERKAMPMVADTMRGVASALIICGLVITGLVMGRDILIPFALAAVLAFILSPAVRFLTRLALPRAAASVAVVIAVVVVVAGISAVFSAQLVSLAGDLAGYKDNIAAKVRAVTGSGIADGTFTRASRSIDAIQQEIKREVGSTDNSGGQIVVAQDTGYTTSTVLSKVFTALGPLAQVGLTILFAIFLLIQYQDLRDRIVRVAGTDNISTTAAALSEAGSLLSRLFLAQAVVNVTFGAFVAVMLWVIGVPNPVLWGVSTAILRFVPFIGAFLSALPPVLLAAAVDPGWGMMIATITLFAVGEPIVGHFIEPMVLGRSVGLSPLAMVVAASFWTVVWGPVGLVLAAPITMALVLLGQYLPSFEFLSVMLGDKPALSPEQEFYHRLLSGDAVAALEEIESHDGEADPISVGEQLALPALVIAASDQRRNRIDAEQIERLAETLDETADVLLAKYERDENERPKSRGRSPAYFVPARGPIDVVAARFIASAIGKATGRPCESSKHASGLMALSAFSESKTQPSAIVISTVGGIDAHQLTILERRAVQLFPGCRVICYCPAGVPESARSRTTERDGAAVPKLRKLRELCSAVEHAGNGSAQEPHITRPTATLPMRVSRGVA